MRSGLGTAVLFGHVKASGASNTDVVRSTSGVSRAGLARLLIQTRKHLCFQQGGEFQLPALCGTQLPTHGLCIRTQLLHRLLQGNIGGNGSGNSILLGTLKLSERKGGQPRVVWHYGGIWAHVGSTEEMDGADFGTRTMPLSAAMPLCAVMRGRLTDRPPPAASTDCAGA